MENQESLPLGAPIPKRVTWNASYVVRVVNPATKALVFALTPAGREFILDQREQKVSWVALSRELGVNHDTVLEMAKREGISRIAPRPPPRVKTFRELAGAEPLPAGHPIAIAELERARMMRFDTETRR